MEIELISSVSVLVQGNNSETMILNSVSIAAQVLLLPIILHIDVFQSVQMEHSRSLLIRLAFYFAPKAHTPMIKNAYQFVQ